MRHVATPPNFAGPFTDDSSFTLIWQQTRVGTDTAMRSLGMVASSPSNLVRHSCAVELHNSSMGGIAQPGYGVTVERALMAATGTFTTGYRPATG